MSYLRTRKCPVCGKPMVTRLTDTGISFECPNSLPATGIASTAAGTTNEEAKRK